MSVRPVRVSLALAVACGAAAVAAPPADSVVADRSRVILDIEAVLAADRPGVLEFIEPGEGDRVTAGQQVAGLKDDVAAAALAVAEAEAANDVEIRYSVKAAEVADAELDKSRAANRQSPGVVPEVELLRLRLSAERAALQIEKAKIDLQIAALGRDKAAAELASHRISSPIDGVVTQVIKRTGEAVNQGDPILRVVSIDAMRVEGFVSVADAFGIRPGDRVAVRLDLPELPQEIRDREFEGRLTFIDVTANPVTRQVRVWATVRNDDGLLKAGLPAAMRIFPETAPPSGGDSTPKAEAAATEPAAEPRR